MFTLRKRISKNKDGKKQYGLVPTIPGLFEFPFMKGRENSDFDLDKLADLWEKYHQDALGKAFCGEPTPSIRVVPVKKSIEGETS